MDEKHLANGDSPEGKPILVLPGTSSKDPSPSRSSELQPYALSRMSSPSSQSSIVVPVRLDVLLFLLNSAARGAQHTLSPASVQGGQGSPSICHHGPAVQSAPNCCGCTPTNHSISQSSGTHPCRGGYGGHGGVTDSRDHRSFEDGNSHRSERKSWPGANSTGGWKVPRSPMGWQEKPRGEGRGRDTGDNWQGRRQNFGRPWGDRRHNAASSASWTSSSQEWRREGSAFGSNYTNVKRTQEGCLRPPWDAPDAKRVSDNTRAGWQKNQGTKEPIRFPGKPANESLAKPAVQESEEDWETDYEGGQTSRAAPEAVSCSSLSEVPTDPSKEDGSAAAADPPRLRLLGSPLPELATKGQAVATPDKPAVAAAEKPSCPNQSKNGGFLSYFSHLYSDLPKESGLEDSSDLVIDVEAESGKEEQSPKHEVGRESESTE